MASIKEGKTDKIQCNFCNIALKKSLSFDYLIEKIESISNEENNMLSTSAKELLVKLDKVPELKGTIEDRSILEKHNNLIGQLMSFVFNPLNCNNEIAAAFPPFGMEPIVSTTKFKKTIGGENKILEIANSNQEDINLIAYLYQAYFFILNSLYDFELPVESLFTLKLTDKQNQSVKYYNKTLDTSFLRVKPIGKLKKLKHEDIISLFDKHSDLDYWNELIPLEKFEFSGFVRLKFNNITREYVVSELKSDLLDKNTIFSKVGYNRILERIRSLMDNPLVRFGIASTSGVESSNSKTFLWKPILSESELMTEDYEGSMYETAYEERQIILTSNLKEVEQNKVTKAFLNVGISSHAIVPLVLDDQVVGILEFGCALPGSLTMLQVKMLHDLFPVFALAIKRSNEEMNDRLRAIMQEQFTAIHPAVEWKFREVASKIMNSEEESANIEPIIFQDVVPIYGASDIRGSSIERNIAIQADLTEQLEKALHVMEIEKNIREIPLLNDLSYKINTHLKTVKSGLKAGDEVSIVEFLKREIDPFLLLLKERDEDMKEPVQEYFNMLDPELHVLYKKRKDFEESLTYINDKVSEIIDKEQVKAQEVFPHYFEKYRTDGVEYNGYLGQSLVNSLKYNEIYLKNIRLWQLLVKVKVARKIYEIQPDLKTKLNITQLILVHSNPLSIAFRQDEKKFDVAGAYNIRYEITKKRIDKAMIKGSNERVTQVGKIAIIYSHADEIAEYKRYIDYMIAQGYLTNNVEELELEDLKGASGLRALRVEVNLNNTNNWQIDQNVLEKVINK